MPSYHPVAGQATEEHDVNAAVDDDESVFEDAISVAQELLMDGGGDDDAESFVFPGATEGRAIGNDGSDDGITNGVNADEEAFDFQTTKRWVEENDDDVTGSNSRNENTNNSNSNSNTKDDSNNGYDNDDAESLHANSLRPYSEQREPQVDANGNQRPPMPAYDPPPPPPPPQPLYSIGSYLFSTEPEEQFEDEHDPEDNRGKSTSKPRAFRFDAYEQVESVRVNARELHARVKGRIPLTPFVWACMGVAVVAVLVMLVIVVIQFTHPVAPIDAQDYGGPNEHPRDDNTMFWDETPPPTSAFAMQTAPPKVPYDESGTSGDLANTEVVWEQLGGDIIGTDPRHHLGETVALSRDGKTLAVAIPGANNAEGQVQVFALKGDGSGWAFMGQRLDGQGQFGVSLALSSDGNILAVGGNLATNDNLFGAETGHVHVYQFFENEWQEMGDPLEGDEIDESMGWSVALSGDGLKLAVGSPMYANENGRIQMFYFHNNTWTRAGPQVVPHRHHGVGYAVALSEDAEHVAVLSTKNDHGEAVHSVTAFTRTNHTHWIEMGEPMEDLGDALDSAVARGLSMSGDGMTVAVASHYSQNAGKDAVTVFRYGQSSWDVLGRIQMNGRYDDDEADRISVSLDYDGSVIAIGHSRTGGDGMVRVYTTEDMTPIGQTIDGTDAFGECVALSGDGKTMAVGSGRLHGKKGMAQTFHLVNAN